MDNNIVSNKMDVAVQTCYRSVRSLYSTLIDFVVDNLAFYVTENGERLSALPFCIKNRILQRFTTSTYFWRNVDFKAVLTAVTSEQTVCINLTATSVDDEMLSIISKCKAVKKLYLSRTRCANVTTYGLNNLLQNCPNLRYFVLTHCKALNDVVLDCLADYCPNIMALDIGGCAEVTDYGIKKISKLRKLTSLTFSSTKITDKGISYLVSGPSAFTLKEFRIENTRVTDRGLQDVATHCENIEILSYCAIPDRQRASSNVSCPTFEKELKHLKQLMWTVNW